MLVCSLLCLVSVTWLGQDTVAVLGEIGLDGAEMKALAAEGIIHVGGPSKL